MGEKIHLMGVIESLMNDQEKCLYLCQHALRPVNTDHCGKSQYITADGFNFSNCKYIKKCKCMVQFKVEKCLKLQRMCGGKRHIDTTSQVFHTDDTTNKG